MTDFNASDYTGYSGGSKRYNFDGGELLSQEQQLDLNIDIIQRTNPWMFESDPEGTMALASAGLPPEQLAYNTSALFAMKGVEEQRSQLESLDPISQRAVFAQLSPQEQIALHQIGFRASSAQSAGNSSFVGGVIGGTLDVVGMGWNAVSEVGGPVLGGALDIMEWVGDQPAHLYRTIRALDGEAQWAALIGAGLAIGLTGGAALGVAGAMGLGSLSTAGMIGGIGLAGAGAASFAAQSVITNPKDWVDAWNSTANGERSFTVGSQRRARGLLKNSQYQNLVAELAANAGGLPGFDMYALAEETAGHRGGNNLLEAIRLTASTFADEGTPEYQAIAGALQVLSEEEVFQDAVRELNHGKVSPGRDFANLMPFLEQGSTAYNLVSGLTDAAWVFGMDPFIGAGAARRAFKVSRYGIIPNGAGVDKFIRLSNENRQIRAVHDQIARAVQTENFMLMPKHSQGMYLPMLEYKRARMAAGEVFDRAKFLEAMTEGNKLELIAQGHGTIRGVSGPLILATSSDSTALGAFRKEFRRMTTALDDGWMAKHAASGEAKELDEIPSLTRWANEQQVDLDYLKVAEDTGDVVKSVGTKAGEALGHLPPARSFGHFVENMGRMASRGRAVDLHDVESMKRHTDQIGRALRLPSEVRESWLNDVLSQGSTNARMVVMNAYLDNALTMAGLEATDEGRRLKRDFLQKIKQMYTVGDANDVRVGGINLSRAVLPESQMAEFMLMPDFAELQKLADRAFLYKQTARIVDGDKMSAGVNRIWKPLVILRPGFVPRAAGEEALAWFARMGAGSIAQELGARSIARHNFRREVVKKVDDLMAEVGWNQKEVLRQLTPAERAAYLSDPNPAGIRAVSWMAERVGNRSPREQLIEGYYNFRNKQVFSDETFAKLAGSQFAPLTLGKEASWRRMIAGGIDPSIQKAADEWVRTASDAIMRSTTAATHSVGQVDILNPQTEVVYNQDGIPIAMVPVKGEFETKLARDPAVDMARHRNIEEYFADEVVRDPMVRHYSHQWPKAMANVPYSKADHAANIEAAATVKSYAGRMIARAMLDGRGDIWAATGIKLIDGREVKIGRLIEKLASEGTELTGDGVVAMLRRYSEDLKKAEQFKDAARYKRLADEVEQVAPAIDAINALADPNARGWARGSFAQELLSHNRYYDPDGLAAFANGTNLGTVPKRKLFRGIKDQSTAYIDDEGYLVLKPQFQEGSQGNVISTATQADQALSYAVTPGAYNLGADYAHGALIEFDADIALGHLGVTWDQVVANPRANMDKLQQRGASIITEGIDEGEVPLHFGELDPTQQIADLKRFNDETAAEIETIRNLMDDIVRQNSADDAARVGQLNSELDDLHAQMAALPDDADVESIRQIERQIEEIQIQKEAFALGADSADGISLEVVELENEASQLGQRLAERQQRIRDLEERLTSGAQFADPTEVLRLPPGSFRFVPADEMEAIAQSSTDARWSSWLNKVKFSEGDVTVEQAHIAVAQAIENIPFDMTEAYSDARFAKGWIRVQDPDTEGAFRLVDPEVMSGYLEENIPNVYDVMRIAGFSPTPDGLKHFTRNVLEGRALNPTGLEAFELRGMGGYQVPQWSEWIDETDDYEELARTLGNIYMRPEHQDKMRAAGRTLMNDGTPVVQPMSEGSTRVYLPMMEQVDQFDELVRELVLDMGVDLQASLMDDAMRQQFVEAVADRILERGSARHVESAFIRNLDEGAKRNAVALMVNELLSGQNTYLRGHGTAGPIFGAAFDDPRIAKWLQGLLDHDLAKVQEVGWVDIPRGVSEGLGKGDVPDVGFHSKYGNTNAYRLGPERDGKVAFTNATNEVVMPDGSVQLGASPLQAIEEFARTTTEEMAKHHRYGAKVGFKVREDLSEPIYRKSLNTEELIAINPGDTLLEDTLIYNAAGELIDENPAAFMEMTTVREADGEHAWAVLGNMMVDSAAARTGGRLEVPRSVITPGETDTVVMKSARVDDIDPVADQLLNVGRAPKYQMMKNGRFDKATRKGFEWISTSLDSLVRRPMSFHYYTAARKDSRGWYDLWVNKDNLAGIANDFERELALLADDLFIDPIARESVETILGATPGSLDDKVIAGWLAHAVDDPAKWQDEMLAMRDAHVAWDNGDVATAYQDLAGRQINVRAMQMAHVDLLEEGNLAEMLVRAYIKETPAKAWESAATLNAHLKTAKLGLPSVTPEKFKFLKAAKNNIEHVDDLVHRHSFKRAVDNVVPFLDDHQERSQFAVIARNYLPFWYAEELFLKRWAKSLTIAPDAIRRGQLLYMGMESAGIIQTDANGKDWVVYPGSGMMNEALSKIIPGGDTLPVGTVFMASTDSMLPGLNANLGAPQPGPVPALMGHAASEATRFFGENNSVLPLDFLKEIHPDIVDARRRIFGDISTSQFSQSGWKAGITQFVPSSARRMWEALMSDETSSVKYANAMNYAMANMLAEDPELLEDANPWELQEFLDKAREHARIILVGQAMTGFIVPGAPISMNTGDQWSLNWLTGVGVENPDQIVSKQYREFIDTFGIDEGTQHFLHQYPNSSLEDIINPMAFTEGMTKSVSGAQLPASRTGMRWYLDNAEWVNANPEAGAWFIPGDKDDDEFDFFSYGQQVITGLRKRQAPEDYLRAMLYRQAAPKYFMAKDQFDEAMASTSDPNQRRSIRANWDAWSTTFRGANPVFDEELREGEGRKRRQRTIEQMRMAAKDPSAPVTPYSAAIRELVESFDAYWVARSKLQTNRRAATLAQKDQLMARFREYGEQWARNNPEVAMLWQSVYKLESQF